jgi:hypothetical protein
MAAVAVRRSGVERGPGGGVRARGRGALRRRWGSLRRHPGVRRSGEAGGLGGLGGLGALERRGGRGRLAGRRLSGFGGLGLHGLGVLRDGDDANRGLNGEDGVAAPALPGEQIGAAGRGLHDGRGDGDDAHLGENEEGQNKDPHSGRPGHLSSRKPGGYVTPPSSRAGLGRRSLSPLGSACLADSDGPGKQSPTWSLRQPEGSPWHWRPRSAGER